MTRWANIGGSLEPGEHAFAGAVRESDEELSIEAARLVGASIAEVIECGTDRVPYTLFVLDVPTRFHDARLSWENDALSRWENDALYWWHMDEVGRLALHAGFARAWATLYP